MNKTFAVFANGGTMTTAQTALWQYDYGQILVVQGIELPNAYEVQFCNAGDSTTITSVGDSTGVVIPDQFLQNGETIYAYIYLHTGNADGETEYKITIPVMDRAEPTDIEPTPAQESTIGQLIDALNAGVEAAEEAAEKGPQIIDGYWRIWDAEAGEYVNTNVKAEGEDGEPGTPGADGSNAWMIDVAYTSTVGTTIRAKTEHLIGPPNARPMYGDVLFVSDGRFGNIFSPGTRITMATLLGDLHGDPGEDGTSPGVTITEIEGGHRITITDEAHPDGQSFDVMDGQGGSGSSDYNDLSNKPQIAGVTLSGDKSLADLGIAAASDIPTVPVQSVNNKTGAVVLNASDVGAGTYTKPSSGIPKTDLAAAVQTSLGKADTALQSAPVTSVNGQTGAVTVPEPFFVTYSTSDMTTWTCDKTFAQITAAMVAGKQVVMIGSVGGTPIAQSCDTLLADYGTRLDFWIRYGRNGWYHIIHNDDDSIEFYNAYIDSQDLDAVASDQGVSEAGKFLVVGSNGIVTTASVPSAQGVNF